MGSLGLLRRVALGACGASRQEAFALSRLFSDAPGFGAEPEAATGFAPRERRPPGFKVFIGNMAWRTDNQGLWEAMNQFGEVLDARVVFCRETGRSRGFGFVTFAAQAAAEDALAAAQEESINVDGRPLRVDYAQERGPRPVRNFDDGGGY